MFGNMSEERRIAELEGKVVAITQALEIIANARAGGIDQKALLAKLEEVK